MSTDPEGAPPRKGVHAIDPLEGLDIASELDSLLSDLDNIDLGAEERRPGDAPTVTLDDELNVVTAEEEPAPTPAKPRVQAPFGLAGSLLAAPGARRLPEDPDDALETEVELSDNDFLKELGFGDSSPELVAPGPAAPTARVSHVADAVSREAAAAQQERIEELEAEVSKLTERHRRAAADFDNVRKRLHREKQDAIQFANDKLVKELLPVLDNMELALEHSASTDFDQFVNGVRMVSKLMLQQLGKYGLEPFDAAGEPFDPHRHEAMAQVPNGEVSPNTVLAVAQRGYHLYQRLLRPALVTVSMAAPAGWKPVQPASDEEAAPETEAADEILLADTSAEEILEVGDDEQITDELIIAEAVEDTEVAAEGPPPVPLDAI
ncbi:MAG: molecular chaperone GrpE, partial [Myxococcota bacterium]